MTRKTTAHLFYSLNGVSEAPDQWQFDSFGQEEGERMGASISAVSDVVIGRKLWSEWRDYWTSSAADDPFGEFINPIPKHVEIGRASCRERVSQNVKIPVVAGSLKKK